MDAAVLEGQNHLSLSVHQACVAVIGHSPGPFVLADDRAYIFVFYGNELLAVVVDDARVAVLPDAVLRAVELDAVKLRLGQGLEGDGALLEFHILRRKRRDDGGVPLVAHATQAKFIDLPFLLFLSFLGLGLAGDGVGLAHVFAHINLLEHGLQNPETGRGLGVSLVVEDIGVVPDALLARLGVRQHHAGVVVVAVIICLEGDLAAEGVVLVIIVVSVAVVQGAGNEAGDSAPQHRGAGPDGSTG